MDGWEQTAMTSRRTCPNLNHRRTDAPVRFCPTCGGVVNGNAAEVAKLEAMLEKLDALLDKLNQTVGKANEIVGKPNED